MSVVAIERGWPQLFDAAEPGSGLDGLFVRLWEELTSGRVVRCPICDGEMRPEYGVHASSREGRCDDCGARLT